MTGRIILAALSFTSIGCMGFAIPIAGEGWSGPTNPQPGQMIAAHIVWNETFGQLDGTEPPILWHVGDNCVDSGGSKWGPEYGTPGAFQDSGDCVFGQYQASGWSQASEYNAPNRVDAEWNGNFSAQQTLAHELCHAMRQFTTGDDDSNHASNCFVGTDGKPYSGIGDTAPGSMVYQANAALIAAGF
jgi:hypothetical protein